jgi:hypothetical protein
MSGGRGPVRRCLLYVVHCCRSVVALLVLPIGLVAERHGEGRCHGQISSSFGTSPERLEKATVACVCLIELAQGTKDFEGACSSL